MKLYLTGSARMSIPETSQYSHNVYSQNRKTKGIVVKPILSSEFNSNSRTQNDFTDIGSQCQEQCIMVVFRNS